MSGELTYKSFGKDKTKTEKYTIDESMWKEINTGQTLNVTIKDGKIIEWHID